MAKIRDLIESSMRLVGVLAQGENPSAQDAADSLAAFKSMLDIWSLEDLIIPSERRRLFSLVSGQGVYTIGPLGDVDIPRPVSIERAGLVISTGADESEYAMKLFAPQEWAGVTQKNKQSDLPTAIYVEGTSPLETVNVWPVPAAENRIAIYSREPLDSNLTLNDDFEFPIGYYQALRYNLALELASEFQREPSALVLKNADNSKGAIMAINSRDTLLTSDPALVSGRTCDIKAGR